MKPIELTMSAFGPFGDEVNVPFHELGTHGLFLISGDTGAGKTTIFDAISFALFGNASGENRTSDSFRSDYAKGDIKTFVTLTFLHKGKEYKITRNPTYQRPKKVGEGTTEEKANATLYLPDGNVVTGASTVTSKVIELLGVDWAQFKQIAMIAQGEFMKLLTADSKERGPILRKVFGTSIYDQVQRKVKSMAIELGNQCKTIDKSIVQYLEGILCDENNSNYERITSFKEAKDKDIHQTSIIMELLVSILEEDKQQYEKLIEEKGQLNEVITKLIKEYQDAVQVNRFLDEIEEVKEQQNILLKRSSEISEKEQKIQLAKKALYTVKPSYDNLQRVLVELNQLEKIISDQQIKEQELDKKHALLKEAKEKTEDYPEQMRELSIAITKLQEEVTKWEQSIVLTKQLSEAKNNIVLLEKNEVQLLMRKEQLQKEQTEAMEAGKEYQRLQTKLFEIKEEKSRLEQFLKQLKSIYEEMKVIENEESRQKELDEIYSKKEAEYSKLYKSFHEAELLYYRGQAGILATQLSENEPCPVCGSLHHPKKAIQLEGILSKDKLEEFKAEVEKTNQELAECLGECRQQRNKITYLLEKVESSLDEILPNHTKENSKELVIQAFNEYKSQYGQVINSMSEVVEDLKVKEKAQENLSNIVNELKLLEERIQTDKEKVQGVRSIITSKEASLEMIQNDLQTKSLEEAKDAYQRKQMSYSHMQKERNDAVEAFTACDNEWIRLNSVLKENIKKQIELSNRQKESEQSFHISLEKASFQSINDFQAVLMSEEEIETLTEEVVNYQRSCQSIIERLNYLENVTKDKSKIDVSSYLKEQEKLQEKRKQCDDKIQKIYYRIQNNEAIYNNTMKRYKEQEQVRASYLQVNDLANTANGELRGKAKLPFEQYVQAFYFNQVIAEANKRLYHMTNSQYELRRKEDASNYRVVSGLELEVMDYYTGKTRSVMSLSGGESFKASLSLALGLSDVIQSFAGGIELDTMFIDEGFGSLDGNSLDQAIETLISLSHGNRLVGIISHVSELKERIEKQILLTKSMEGSKIKVK